MGKSKEEREREVNHLVLCSVLTNHLQGQTTLNTIGCKKQTGRRKQANKHQLLKRGNKIPMEGDIKCGAQTEGKTIQKLPHLGIHPIYSYETQTLL